MIEPGLKILAAALAAAAAYFYSVDEKDWLFACIVLASCSFFLSMRFGIKRRMAATADDAESRISTDR